VTRRVDRERFRTQSRLESDSKFKIHPKEFTTKPKLQRTADKVLRLLSVHISFAVDVR
jgi:hypothetical protein